jgi:hypothetical protein
MGFRPPGSDRDPPRDDRRRSERFSLVVTVALRWKGPSGEFLRCEGRAVEGNSEGGFLEIPAPLSAGTEVELQNILSGEAVRARVVRERFSKQGAFEGIGVAFLSTAPAFWGVTFRLKKASAELRALEEEIKYGGIDSRVLRDFRDAVDYVRKTAWAVQEWQERQIQQRDTATVLPLLTAERVRRTTELSTIILTDLADKQITPETTGMVELLLAIERLHARLADSLASRESS